MGSTAPTIPTMTQTMASANRRMSISLNVLWLVGRVPASRVDFLKKRNRKQGFNVRLRCSLVLEAGLEPAQPVLAKGF